MSLQRNSARFSKLVNVTALAGWSGFDDLTIFVDLLMPDSAGFDPRHSFQKRLSRLLCRTPQTPHNCLVRMARSFGARDLRIFVGVALPSGGSFHHGRSPPGGGVWFGRFY